MYILTVEMRIRPEHCDNFAAAITRQAQSSVSEESDCHEFQVARSEEDPQLFLLYEVYSDRAAFDHHCELPRSKESGARTRPWVESTTVKFWSALDDLAR